MPGRVKSAVERALKMAKTMCWVAVIYVVGTNRIQLRAVKTEADVEEILGDGTALVSRVTDWRILAQDLVADGVRFKPDRGHRIEYFSESRKQVYEVMPAGGENCYVPTDPWDTGWKIHTKLIDEA